MEFKIENAVVSDVSQILGLIKELAEFENEPEQVEITEEELRNDGFGSNPLYHCFVAREPKTADLLGMALIYFRYSTWKGKSIHLLAAHRGAGPYSIRAKRLNRPSFRAAHRGARPAPRHCHSWP